MDSLLRNRLLPAFGHLSLDRINPAGVEAWFDRYSVTAPGNANKALALLRQIMNHAIADGHIALNPTRRTRINSRPRLTRFLSAEEIVRLHEALDQCVTERPAWARQADIIRLLLFTGARKSEIKNLQWSEVDGDTLRLMDSKTGPRTVYLSEDARAVTGRQRDGNGPFVFPSPVNPERPYGDNLRLWPRVRERAGLSGVRLHDLRHSYGTRTRQDAQFAKNDSLCDPHGAEIGSPRDDRDVFTPCHVLLWATTRWYMKTTGRFQTVFKTLPHCANGRYPWQRMTSRPAPGRFTCPGWPARIWAEPRRPVHAMSSLPFLLSKRTRSTGPGR